MYRHLIAAFIAFTSLLTLDLPSQAQRLEVGLRGGMTLSTLHGDEFALIHIPEGEENEIGYYFGNVGQRAGAQLTGVLAVPLTDWLALQSELQYAQKGATITVERYASCGGPRVYCIPSLIEQVHLSYRLSYLQLPVLLRARIPVLRSLEVGLLAGPSVGLHLRSELATETFEVSGLPHVAKPEAHPQLGVAGGVEVSYRLGRGGTLLLDARLHPALTEIPLAPQDGSVKSTAFEASLG